MRACGINFPDLLVVQGKYQFKPTPPFSPGGEVAGVVEAVGAGVSDLRVGDRVVAMGSSGGIAEKFVTDASRTVPIPERRRLRHGGLPPDGVRHDAARAARPGADARGRDAARARRGRRRRALGGADRKAHGRARHRGGVERGEAGGLPASRGRRGHRLRARGPEGARQGADGRRGRGRGLRRRGRALSPSPRCARRRGRGGFSSSASPPATSRACLRTSRCSRGVRSSGSSGGWR